MRTLASPSAVNHLTPPIILLSPASAWADLEAKIAFVIEHLFEFYGDDAGWSFAARGMEAPVSKVE